MAKPLILTTIGLAKLASATPEDQLEIASVAVGDGNGSYPPLDPSMTALVNEVWRGTASAPIRDPDNDAVLIFETIIPPEDGGFFIREVGLFDADGDLIAIGQTGLVEKPSGGSGTPMTMTVRVRLALANASQTNLIINDAPYIDHQALTNRNASNAHPISSITGLQGALDGKLAIVQNLADLDDVAAARSNLGLGTAATHNVTASPTDTTPGRVLTVGSLGLGGAAVAAVSPHDYPIGSFISSNELTESNAVSLGFPALGGDPSTPRYWNAITFGTSTRTTQIASEVFGVGTTRGRTFVRIKHDATWYPWFEFYHSGNLADAFKGANQSLSSHGYQKLPGGLIIQWGSLTTSDTNGTVTFPTAFPNACFSVVAHDYAAAVDDISIVRFNLPTNTQVSWLAQTYTGSSTFPAYWTWIAIGY